MRKIILLTAILLIPLSWGCRNGKKSENVEELMTHRTLGLAYLEEFKLDEAEKEFLEFIDLAPDDKFGYANLGLTYLRMGKYPEAEKKLKTAIKIDSLDADVRLILSTVYRMNDEQDKSVSELKKALSFSPGHVKILYEISELYSQKDDPESTSERKKYLEELITNAPGNLVPKLNLTEILIKEGDSDKALEQLEIIRKQFPEFPKEAVPYYDKAVANFRKKDMNEARMNFTIFHNYMKVSPPYQEGMKDLKGPGGSLIGFPVITFDRQSPAAAGSENESILDLIKYNPVPDAAGLNIIKAAGSTEFGEYSHTEAADYDSDGDTDIYLSCYDSESQTFRHLLFNNNSGVFTDVAAEAGLSHSGRETSAIFGDYDNDGFQDLFVLREEGDILYRNTGNGKFEDVTGKSLTASTTGGNMALFFDADHDGDLDLFEARQNVNLLFRNNGDGTFTEQAEKMNLAGVGAVSTDAAFGDFDEDGDIDLIVINENGSNAFYSNQRQGVFSDYTVEGGLESQGGSGKICVSDYNNDGFLDLFITSLNGENQLYSNPGNGKFIKDKNSDAINRTVRHVMIHDACFLDFDNDGYSDLFIAGESKSNPGKNLFLFHNDGKGKFDDVSDLLPDEIKSGRVIALFDYNDDGDTDIALSQSEGGIILLRNDGGNNNHFVKIKLVGLRAGSAKNNYFGIGAKVEVRAGDLYQTAVVTDPDVRFGIGKKAMADIIRITWTNGVPQNIFYPAADQALIEAQTLKGSCPFLYAWNGEKFSFVKDIMWRSGLGMPLGIMGGNTAYAFADASDDYIKIPGECLKEENGIYSLQVTSELWETIYTDRIRLVAVDHSDTTDIYVEEQFTPPPFPGMKIFNTGKKILPVSAVDSHGNNLLTFINKKDDIYHSDFSSDKYQGITELHDIILDPGKTRVDKLFMFMNGWIFPTDASINVALSQSDSLKALPPQIQVINEKGQWETITGSIGFPMGKDKTVIADLSGRFKTKDHRIRIRTNMEIYWDYIFFADNLLEKPAGITEMQPVSADLHYRGFSAQYRKGSRYGPHWFDYSEVSKEPKWRDLKGYYTRYGDVLPLLTESDNKYIISNAGDEISIKFDAKGLPALKKGFKRDFLINSVGWVKDGDINTAFGNSVLPLPFHGMKSYPPSPDDVYPSDPELKRYNDEYNTRFVSGEAYINAVKNK
ncbi:MAG TPA: FG-GAP-like repeat-containing protein [Bacteroidales bacterium]|nr:FG-GAP-like repeat-containing protein [Bacteroidales bacterium]